MLAAFGLRSWLGAALDPFPFLVFFPPIVLASLLFDRGSGFLATFLATGVALSFVEPIRSFAVPDAGLHPGSLAPPVAQGNLSSAPVH
jgi:hypothetical protein